MTGSVPPASHGSPSGRAHAADGLIVIDKPAGPTSHDVVALVRRATGIRKVGHTGTLDPFAQGVLPVLLGQATRLAQFFTAVEKEYEAEVRLGAATDTYDATGRVLEPPTPRARSTWPGTAEVEGAVAAFRGTHLQVPPAFSAKKVLGIPAYSLARRDRPVRLDPVRVTIHALDILSFAGDRLRLRIVCSSGFYVRSLAHEIGERLGTGAYLEALTRTRSGEFRLDDAVSVAELEDDPSAALARTIPMTGLLGSLPALVLTPGGVIRASRGNPVGPAHLVWPPPPDGAGARNVRLFDQAGRLVAIAQPTSELGILHPGVVLG